MNLYNFLPKLYKHSFLWLEITSIKVYVLDDNGKVPGCQYTLIEEKVDNLIKI